MQNLIVSYQLENGVATITMDDGDKNLISPTMLDQLNDALSRAKREKAVVILAGREGIFSAGFDLKILKSGAFNSYKMLIGGFQLAARLLSFPTPVVIACNGHAIAMGAFLVLSGDYRIGVSGAYKIVANEVAIGLTLPYAAIEVCKQRLNKSHYERATLLSELYTPDTAVDAGYLDQVVSDNALLLKTSNDKAQELSKLNLKAHKESKERVRKKTHRAMRRAIVKDKIDFLLLGLRKMVGK